GQPQSKHWSFSRSLLLHLSRSSIALLRLLHRLMRRGTGHAHERCSSKLSGAADGEAVCARGCVLLDWLVVSAGCGWRDRAGGRWWGFGGGRGGFGQDGRGPYSAGAAVSCGAGAGGRNIGSGGNGRGAAGGFGGGGGGRGGN